MVMNRTERLPVSLTPNEKEAVRAAAEQLGVSMAEVLRQAFHRYAERLDRRRRDAGAAGGDDRGSNTGDGEKEPDGTGRTDAPSVDDLRNQLGDESTEEGAKDSDVNGETSERSAIERLLFGTDAKDT